MTSRRLLLLLWNCRPDTTNVIIPAKAREYVFIGVGLCVCVCVSVTTLTEKILDGFVPNFIVKVPRGKGKTKFVFRYDR